jgi:hypothetical protein
MPKQPGKSGAIFPRSPLDCAQPDALQGCLTFYGYHGRIGNDGANGILKTCLNLLTKLLAIFGRRIDRFAKFIFGHSDQPSNRLLLISGGHARRW